MSPFETAPLPVPGAIRDMCERTWDDLAGPGSSWTGSERIAVAARARAVRLGADPEPSRLPSAAITAAGVLAAHPAGTSREWVDAVVADIGKAGYVEIAGIVARVIAIDTFTRLLGVAPMPLPTPRPGDPAPVEPPQSAREGNTWIPMAGFPIPPFVLSLVPPEQTATNATATALYMTGEKMEDPDIVIDGLHRTQIEVVATTVSHRNECFY
jgi:hypothetical protein